MRRLGCCSALGVCLAVILLGGCGNPYALKATSPRYHAATTAGSIQFTDPKLYRRELLINERRVEIEYLDGLIQNSGSATFEPEVIRELQTVTALAGAIGLSFDPAAGDAYRHGQERSRIQDEIDILKLQLQLDQLKREAELFRAALATQEAASENLDLQPGTAPSSTSNVAATQRLDAAIASLTTLLSTALAGKGEALVKGGAAQNPIDLFQDRAAYRSVLNSAKNAASLDELHDRDGAALLRLHFSATVLPPAKDYMDTLGMLRMQVKAPQIEYRDLEELYSGWLGYVNGIANLPTKAAGNRFEVNPALIGLFNAAELFDIGYFYYGTRKDKSACPGIALERDASNRECGELSIVLPRMKSIIFSQSGSNVSIQHVYDHLLDKHMCYPDAFSGTQAFLERNSTFDIMDPIPAAAGVTSQDSGPRCGAGKGAHGLAPQQVLEAAMYAQVISNQLSTMELQAHKILLERGIDRPQTSLALTEFANAGRAAGRLVTAYISHAQRRGKMAKVSDYATTALPYRFTDVVIAPDKRVAVYDVGPREQVQQLSTVARAAEAIGLAAAIAGKVPTKGVGIDSNIAYSRSATGKADVLERTPLVISFAEASDGVQNLPAFGWLLGPRVTLDAEGQQLILEQRLKSYDLSVDLSVPGWWPYLELVAETAWAPSWVNEVGAPAGTGAGRRSVRVQLPKNSADFAALTNRLSGNTSVRYASIDGLQPRVISACGANLSLQITGENIWRATTVIVGGRKFDGSDIAVMPDMNGVLVSIASAGFPAVETDSSGKMRMRITVLTPYGRPETEAELVGAKADGTCDKPEPTPPAAESAEPKKDQKAATGASTSP